MSISPTPADNQQPSNATSWAQQNTHTLRVENVPAGALNLNVDGRQITSPLQGFGQMWQKTYRVSLKGSTVEPTKVISVWKEHFAEFWPSNSRFFGPITGIAPGEVALLNLKISGVPLSTGVLVLYADEESFTLMTPQGHVFAGWITFSSYEENGGLVVQAQVLMRANDPIYEIGFRIGFNKQEDLFWQHTLKSLAAEFGVDEPVQMVVICVDPRVQWSQAKNVWHNAAMRTTMYKMAAPLRWIRRSRR